MDRATCTVCESRLPSRDEREHDQGRPRLYCGTECAKLGRWIREARANAARTAARGYPAALDRVEVAVARKLDEVRASVAA